MNPSTVRVLIEISLATLIIVGALDLFTIYIKNRIRK